MTPWRRVRAVLWRFLLGVLAIECGWLVIANAFLASGLLSRLISSKDGSTIFTYRRAFSPYPARVWIQDLELLEKDDKQLFCLGIDEAWTSVWLPGLPNQVFHASNVDAKGVRFLFRHRFPKGETPSKVAPAYPVIGAFEELEAPPEDVQIATDTGPGPWVIYIEGVHAEARELWFQEFRYAGPAVATGAFWLQPGKHLWVDAALRTDDGILEIGDRVAATGVRDRSRVTLPPFDPTVPDGAEFFHHVDIVDTITASAADLSFASLYFPDGTRFRDGSGDVHGHLEMHEGVLNPATALHYETARLVAGDDAWTGVAAGTFDWQVKDDGRIQLETHVDHASVTREGTKIAPAEVDDATVSVVGKGTDVAQPWTTVDTRLSVAHAAVPDIRLFDLGALHRDGVFIDHGAATASGHVRIDEHGAIGGHARLAGQGLAGRISGASVHGELAAYVDAEPSVAGVLKLGDARIDLRDVGVSKGDAHVEHWWARADLGPTRLALGGTAIDATSALIHGKDGTPVVALLLGTGVLPGALDDIVRGHPLTAKITATRAGRSLTVTVDKADAAPFDVTGNAHFGDGPVRGSFRVAAGPLFANVRLDEGGSHFVPFKEDPPSR